MRTGILRLDDQIKKIKKQKKIVLGELEALTEQKLSRKIKRARREPLEKKWRELWEELKGLYDKKKELLAKTESLVVLTKANESPNAINKLEEYRKKGMTKTKVKKDQNASFGFIFDKWEKDFVEELRTYPESSRDIYKFKETNFRKYGNVMPLFDDPPVEEEAKKYIDYVEKKYDLIKNKKYLKDRKKDLRDFMFLHLPKYLKEAFLKDKLKEAGKNFLYIDKEIEQVFTNFKVGESVITSEHREYMLGAIGKFYELAVNYKESDNPDIRKMADKLWGKLNGFLSNKNFSVSRLLGMFSDYKTLKNFVKHAPNKKIGYIDIKSNRHDEIKKSPTFLENPYKRIVSIEVEMVGGNPYKLQEKNKKGDQYQNNIEKDASLGSYGVEYQISLLNGDLLFDEIDKAYKDLKESGYQKNPNAGLHFHYDTSDFGPKDYENLVNVIYQVEDNIFDLVDETRKESKYSRSVKKGVNKYRKNKNLYLHDFMIDEGMMHYSGVSFQHISDPHPHIEFRYAGSVDDPEVVKAYSLMYNSLLDKVKKGKFELKEMDTIHFLKWLDIYEDVLIEKYKELERGRKLFLK